MLGYKYPNILNSRRKHKIFRTWQKFEIKNMLRLSNFYSHLDFRVIIRKHAYQRQSNSFLKFPQHPLFEYVSVHIQCMVATSE